MDTAEPEVLDIENIVPNEWNPNVMGAKEFARLVKEIETVGFIDFPQVVPLADGKYQLLGGEHRVRAAKELGYTAIPCAVLRGKKWDDTDLKKLVTVRLNVLHGKVDPTRMALLYNEMAEKYGAEALQEVFAYTDNQGWKALMKGIGKAVGAANLDPERAKKFQQDAKEAKTVDDLTRILQQLFANYGDTVSHSFMVFTHGNQEHIYVNMDKKTHAGMKKVMKYCTNSGQDINAVLGVAVQALADSLKPAVKAKKPDPPDPVKF
jgi:hypothetical protein